MIPRRHNRLTATSILTKETSQMPALADRLVRRTFNVPNSLLRRLRTPRSAVFAAVVVALGAAGASTAAAASPGWAPIAATNPTNLPPLRSETQRLLVSAEGGFFKLQIHRSAKGRARFTEGSTTATGAVAFSQSGGEGEVVPGQAITGEIGTPPGETITAVSGNTLTLSQPATATTGLVNGTGFKADMTIGETGQIAVGAGAQAVEAALNAALPTGASASVSGGPESGGQSRYLVTFGGTLADKGIGSMQVDESLLTGPSHYANVLVTERGGRGLGELTLFAQNVGGVASTSAPVTYSVTLPAGTSVASFPYSDGPWNCGSVPYGATSFSCTTTETVTAGQPLEAISVPIETAEPAASSNKKIQITSVSGGGDPTPAVPGPDCPGCELPITISGLPASPGVQSVIAGSYDENGNPDTTAGDHPYFATSAFFVNTVVNPVSGRIVPAGEFKDIDVDIPPGFLGNPIAVPACPPAELGLCSKNTVVGRIFPLLEVTRNLQLPAPVYNVEAPQGYPAAFYFEVGEEGGHVPLHASGSLRSDKDYGLTVSSTETPQIATVMGAFFAFWGVPGDPSHDAQRCDSKACGPYTGGPVTAFLTNAADCSEQASVAAANAANEGFIPVVGRFTFWQNPGQIFEKSAGVPPVTGCENLEFEAATPGHPGVGFSFEPSDTKSDSPASFRTELTVPSEGLTDPSKLTTPEIKEAVVKLPEGVSLTPLAPMALRPAPRPRSASRT